MHRVQLVLPVILILLIIPSVVSGYSFVDCKYEDHGDYWLVTGDCYEFRHSVSNSQKIPYTAILKLGKTDSLDKIRDHTVIKVKTSQIVSGCPEPDDYVIWWVGDIDNIKIYVPIAPGCRVYNVFYPFRQVADSYIKVYKEVELIEGIAPQKFGAVKPLPRDVDDPEELPYVYRLEEDDWHFSGVYPDSVFAEDENYWYVTRLFGSVGLYAPEYLDNPARDLIVYAVTYDGSGDKEITIEYSEDGKTWSKATNIVGNNITKIEFPPEALYILITAPSGVAIYKNAYLTLLTQIPSRPIPTAEPIPPPDSNPEDKIVLPAIGAVSVYEFTGILIAVMSSIAIAVEVVRRLSKDIKKLPSRIRKTLNKYKYKH